MRIFLVKLNDKTFIHAIIIPSITKQIMHDKISL